MMISIIIILVSVLFDTVTCYYYNSINTTLYTPSYNGAQDTCVIESVISILYYHDGFAGSRIMCASAAATRSSSGIWYHNGTLPFKYFI